MPERDFGYEFLKIAAANYEPPDESQIRIAEASKDECIDKYFLVGSSVYPEIRRKLESEYLLLSREEVDEAISLGIRRIADNIRLRNQEMRGILYDGEA